MSNNQRIRRTIHLKANLYKYRQRSHGFGFIQNASLAEIRQATDNAKAFASVPIERRGNQTQGGIPNQSNRRGLPSSPSPQNSPRNRQRKPRGELQEEARKLDPTLPKQRKNIHSPCYIVFFSILLPLGIVILVWEAIFDGGGNSGAPLDAVKKEWKN